MKFGHYGFGGASKQFLSDAQKDENKRMRKVSKTIHNASLHLAKSAIEPDTFEHEIAWQAIMLLNRLNGFGECNIITDDDGTTYTW